MREQVEDAAKDILPEQETAQPTGPRSTLRTGRSWRPLKGLGPLRVPGLGRGVDAGTGLCAWC